MISQNHITVVLRDQPSPAKPSLPPMKQEGTPPAAGVGAPRPSAAPAPPRESNVSSSDDNVGVPHKDVYRDHEGSGGIDPDLRDESGGSDTETSAAMSVEPNLDDEEEYLRRTWGGSYPPWHGGYAYPPYPYPPVPPPWMHASGAPMYPPQSQPNYTQYPTAHVSASRSRAGSRRGIPMQD